MKEFKKYLEELLDKCVGKSNMYIDSFLTTLLYNSKYGTENYRIWICQENYARNKLKILLISNKLLYSRQYELGIIEYKKKKTFTYYCNVDYKYASFTVNIFDEIINEDFNTFANKMVETWKTENENIEDEFKRKHRESLYIFKLIMEEFNCSYKEARAKIERSSFLKFTDQEIEELERSKQNARN